jgi:hypothetical protein
MENPLKNLRMQALGPFVPFLVPTLQCPFAEFSKQERQGAMFKCHCLLGGQVCALPLEVAWQNDAECLPAPGTSESLDG